MRHLGTSVPEFCTEFRYLLYGHSGLAWGAILEKIQKCSFFQSMHVHFFWEQGPKMVSAPNVPTRKEHVHTNIYICIYIYICICIYIYKYIYLTWAPARLFACPPPSRPPRRPGRGPCKVYDNMYVYMYMNMHMYMNMYICD